MPHLDKPREQGALGAGLKPRHLTYATIAFIVAVIVTIGIARHGVRKEQLALKG